MVADFGLNNTHEVLYPGKASVTELTMPEFDLILRSGEVMVCLIKDMLRVRVISYYIKVEGHAGCEANLGYVVGAIHDRKSARRGENET